VGHARHISIRIFKEPDFAKADFDGMQFDRVVMNPPFDFEVEHVTLAHSMLKPGGRLVSVMSAGVLFRKDKKTSAFRALVAACGGEFTENAPGSFKASGTDVNTVTVVMPAAA
jgi:16S rRNA G1207 methylase RsmC